MTLETATIQPKNITPDLLKELTAAVATLLNDKSPTKGQIEAFISLFLSKPILVQSSKSKEVLELTIRDQSNCSIMAIVLIKEIERNITPLVDCKTNQPLYIGDQVAFELGAPSGWRTNTGWGCGQTLEVEAGTLEWDSYNACYVIATTNTEEDIQYKSNHKIQGERIYKV